MNQWSNNIIPKNTSDIYDEKSDQFLYITPHNRSLFALMTFYVNGKQFIKHLYEQVPEMFTEED